MHRLSSWPGVWERRLLPTENDLTLAAANPGLTMGHVVSPGFPLPVSYNRGCGLDSQASDGTGDTRDAMDILVH